MEFRYNEKHYGVILRGGENALDRIELFECDGGILQSFSTKEEFLAKASIDGKLLKDVWYLVNDPYWLS